MPAPWWSSISAVVTQTIKMETRRTDQLLRAMDEERDGSVKQRKQEEFPNSISVASLMDDAGAPVSAIDIAGGLSRQNSHPVRTLVSDTSARDRTHQRVVETSRRDGEQRRAARLLQQAPPPPPRPLYLQPFVCYVLTPPLIQSNRHKLPRHSRTSKRRRRSLCGRWSSCSRFQRSCDRWSHRGGTGTRQRGTGSCCE